MEKLNIDLGESPSIIIEEILGKLSIKGWDSNEIHCESRSREKMEMNDVDNNLTLSTKGNCSLRVPINSDIKINCVHGNLEINHISGKIEIREIMGTVNIFNSNSLSAEVINGNSNISHIDDVLSIKSVYGHLNLKDIFGVSTVKECSGNISVSGISGGFDLNNSGNSIFNIDPDPGKEYRISSDGNIFCQVPANAGFEAEIDSKTGIQINAPVIEVEETGPNSKHIQIGGGGSNFLFNAIGKITISVEGHYGRFSQSKHGKDFKDHFDLKSDIVEDAIDALENSLAELDRDLGDLSIKFPDDKAILKKTRKEILKARRDLERDLAASRRQVRRSVKRKTTGPDLVIRKKSDDPVSNEERVKILQMIENGLINVAEAEMLLAAIEGNDDDPLSG